MREKLLFPIKLVILSVILYALASYVSKVYGLVLGVAANLTLPLIRPGVNFKLAGGTFFNVQVGLIPFLALMLATPRIGASKKAKAIALGTAVFLLIDLTLILLGIPLEDSGSFADQTSAIYTLYRTIMLVLPVVFWIASTYPILGELFLPERSKKKERP